MQSFKILFKIKKKNQLAAYIGQVMDAIGMPQIFAEEPEGSQKSTIHLITPQHLKIGSENVRLSI